LAEPNILYEGGEMNLEDFRSEYEKRLNKKGFHYSEIGSSYIKYERHGKRSVVPNDVLTIYFDNQGITKIELIEHSYHYRVETDIYDFKTMEQLLEYLGA
jgi:hypothetical protein